MIDASLAAEVRRQYDLYLREVSDEAHAISLELSLYLLELAHELQPRAVLDLGSGFSSYVLRKYAEAVGATAWSVDHDEEWLDRTRRFVVEAGLSDECMVTWSEFERTIASNGHTPMFDLVLHDLHTVWSRRNNVERVLRLVRPGGALVLDDMDVRRYRRRVEALLDREGVAHYEAREQTLDDLRRFSWVVRP